MGTRRGSPNDDALRVPGPVGPLQAEPITTRSQIDTHLVRSLASSWVQNRIKNGRSVRELPKKITSSEDLLEGELGVGDLDFRRAELREMLGKLVDRGRADVTEVVNILNSAKREIPRIVGLSVANNQRFTRYRQRLHQELMESLREVIRLREAMQGPLKDDFVVTYRAALIAAKTDPVLSRKSAKRGPNPYQRLLRETRDKLRRAGVSQVDMSVLLESTGLRDLTRTRRV